MPARCRPLSLLALVLSAPACRPAAPSAADMARIWRATAPRDDSADSRCNDARRRLAGPLGEVLRGRSRDEVIRLLGEPDEPPHPDRDAFGRDNLDYALGWCDGSFASLVVSFRGRQVTEARQVPSG